MQKLWKKKNYFIKRAFDKLTFGLSSKVGKNFFGRITVFHKKSAYTKKQRIIDYKRFLCSKGILVCLEKNRNHTAFLGLIFFFNGLFTYIILPNTMELGNFYLGFYLNYEKKSNYSTFLYTFPSGTFIHHIAAKSNSYGLFARAAGTCGFIYAKWKSFVFIKLPSGLNIRLSQYSIAVNGVVSNKNHHLWKKKKAGINNLLGKRPTVRGVAMNPVDHPHGGGEGKKPKPVIQKTPWGKRARFVKTVKAKPIVKVPL